MKRHALLILLLPILLLAVALNGCATAPPPAPTATPGPDAGTPAEIVAARTAAVDYLREGARCFVPGRLSLFRPITDGTYTTPAGYDVYRFQAENCLVTVTAQSPRPSEPLYHVAIGDQDTGYCLQAVVSPNGAVLRTGTAAAEARTPGNFSAAYCEEQVYATTSLSATTVTHCGALRLPRWHFLPQLGVFSGVCAPGEAASKPIEGGSWRNKPRAAPGFVRYRGRRPGQCPGLGVSPPRTGPGWCGTGTTCLPGE